MCFNLEGSFYDEEIILDGYVYDDYTVYEL